MRRRPSLLAIGIFAAVSLFLIQSALAVDIAPPDAGFSAWFPVEPEESSEPAPGNRTVTWVARDRSFIYLVGVSRYAKLPESRAELEANLKNFLTGAKGRVLSRKVTTISRPGGRPLPALLFIFAGDPLSGSGIIVSDGDRSYMAMGAKLNDQNGDETEIDRFIMSFKLTAKR
jgi:hypothetical protein